MIILSIMVNLTHSLTSMSLSGVDCFVMLGRGLAGTPNLSQAGFHGAR